jgi:3-oxoacyl-[acyl-carrier protein] reductase
MTDEWEVNINQNLVQKIPLGRFAEPGEIAESVHFLLSDKSNFIIGETLNVNGGLLMD